MNVLHIGTHLDRQRRSPEELLEAWPTLTDLAVAVSRAGAQVTVLQVAADDATLTREGVRFEFIAERAFRAGRRTVFLPQRLAMRAVPLQPDVIHFHGMSMPIQCRWLQRALPATPLLVQDHGGGHPTWWRRPLQRWGLRKAGAACFTSKALASELRAVGGLPAHVRIVEVVESSSWFLPGDQAEAQRTMKFYGDPCVLCVARLIRDKDPATILDAVRIAADRLPDLHLWWCHAEAPLLEDVKAKVAADRTLQSRVHLVGYVAHDRMEDACRAADFFVSASRREGSGYALIESLAVGTTPVVTDIPAFRKIVGNDGVGMLTPVGDAEAMSRALVELASLDRGQLRQRARRHFEETLSFDVIGKQLVQVYRDLVTR